MRNYSQDRLVGYPKTHSLSFYGVQQEKLKLKQLSSREFKISMEIPESTLRTSISSVNEYVVFMSLYLTPQTIRTNGPFQSNFRVSYFEIALQALQ